MNSLSTSEAKKSRLRIVFETFVLLGAIMGWTMGSLVPLFVAGVLFCICALNWRTEAQRQAYGSAWIALGLGGFVVGTAVAIYLGEVKCRPPTSLISPGSPINGQLCMAGISRETLLTPTVGGDLSRPAGHSQWRSCTPQCLINSVAQNKL